MKKIAPVPMVKAADQILLHPGKPNEQNTMIREKTRVSGRGYIIKLQT